jgi:hypothetical protein
MSVVEENGLGGSDGQGLCWQGREEGYLDDAEAEETLLSGSGCMAKTS